jgi:hypothetical protein
LDYIGRIETGTGAAGIDENKWIALIDSHNSLTRRQPRTFIDPFTRELAELPINPTTAIVSISGVAAGSICWAMDGSPMLIVAAKQGQVEPVANIAKVVAILLGARYVPEVAAK